MSDSGIPDPQDPSSIPPPSTQPGGVPPQYPAPPIGGAGGAGSPPPPAPPSSSAPPPSPGMPPQGNPAAVVFSANGSYQYNPRPDIGAAFSWSFEAIKRYLKAHVLSALVYFGLVVAGFVVYFAGILGTASTSKTVYDEYGFETTTANPVGLIIGVALMLLITLLASVVGPALMLSTAKMTADGEIPSVGTAWKRIPWGTVLGVLGLTILGTFVGLILCFIPGIVFSWIAPFMLVIAIDEGVGAKAAWDRMVDLAKQNFWLMLGSGLLASLVNSVGMSACGVGVLFTAPLSYLFLLFMYRGLAGKTIAWWQQTA